MPRRQIRKFDRWVDAGTETLRTRNGNRFFYRLTETANHSILWHALNIALNLRPGRSARTNLFRVAAALAIESALVNGVVKKMFDRGRPVHDEERPHKLRAPKTTSFPSGHATSAFCAAVLFADGRSRPFGKGIFALAGLVSFSRIYVRVHHASDVLAGAAFGWTFGHIARRLLPCRRIRS